MFADSALILTAKEMVSLTDFHNRARQYLDRARRSAVTITKHGRPDLTIADATYFERIERIAAGQILAVLDIQAVPAVDMSAEHADLRSGAADHRGTDGGSVGQ